MTKLWFTSDLHLGHVRINELAGRPFESVEEADECLIESWNAVVDPKDAVMVLGDLVMGNFVKSIANAARLHGEAKLLVPGNHDRVSRLYKGSDAKKAEWAAAYRAAGFTVLAEQLKLKVGGVEALLCHFPYEGDSHGEDRYVDARPKDEGLPLVHGHVHEAWKLNGRQLNVGVDVWGFTPIEEERVAAVLQGHELVS